MAFDIRDTYANASMGETAENLQAKFGIPRDEQDKFAVRSQTLAAAQDAGRLADEIVSVDVPDKRNDP